MSTDRDREAYVKQLSRLTQRERTILAIYCMSRTMTYAQMGYRLHLDEDTIKSHMRVIFSKLELTGLHRDEKRAIMHARYCPLLALTNLDPPPEENPPPPLTPDELREVEELQDPPVLWQPQELRATQRSSDSTFALPIEDTRPRRIPWWVTFAAGGLVVALIMALGIFIGREPFFGQGAAPIAPVTQVTQPPTDVAPLPSPTPLVVTQAVPQVVTQVVVVTATEPPAPPATQTTEFTATPDPTATATEPATTPPDAVLEVGEWWKTPDLWVRISEYDIDTNDIWIKLELWNQTDSQLLLTWSASGNLLLKDNTGYVYPFFRSSEQHSDSYDAQELKLLEFGGYPWTVMSRDTSYLGQSVTDMYLTVSNLSRIEHAEFHIKVPK